MHDALLSNFISFINLKNFIGSQVIPLSLHHRSQRSCSLLVLRWDWVFLGRFLGKKKRAFYFLRADFFPRSREGSFVQSPFLHLHAIEHQSTKCKVTFFISQSSKQQSINPMCSLEHLLPEQYPQTTKPNLSCGRREHSCNATMLRGPRAALQDHAQLLL